MPQKRATAAALAAAVFFGGAATATRAPPPVPAWAAGFSDGAAVQQLIDSAVARGAPSVEIPPGNYMFVGASKQLVIAGASGLRIHGHGPEATSLWFFPGYGIEVLSSVDITVEGVSTDCLTPPHSQGKLVSLDAAAQRVVVDIEDGFPLLDDAYLFNQTCPDGSPGRCAEIKVVFWDAATRRMVQDQQMTNPMGVANCTAATGRCVAQLIIEDPNFTPPAAALITFSPRMWASNQPIPTFYRGTIFVFNCTRALFENVETYSAADMVWVENMGGGGNTYRNVNIKRRANPPYTPRLLAANDDAFHSMSAERGPVVEGCEFSFIADDYVNVHNRLLPLVSYDPASATATVADVGCTPGHGYVGPTPDGSPNGHITHAMGFVAKGDALKLYHVDTHELLGVLVVASTHWVNEDGGAIPPLPAALRGRVEADGVQLWRIAFDAAASSPPAGAVANYTALVQIDRFSSFGAVVQGNHFHDSYNNVGRFAASNLVFRSNTVERCDDGIHVSYDIAKFNFLEGSLGMRNISFINNTFNSVRGCGAGRSGGRGCEQVCTNITCVLSHVDPVLI